MRVLRENSGFQYVGVIIKGRKYIYINAFPLAEVDPNKTNRPTFDPSKSALIICDGGSAYWGALFDITTKQFSFLSFNGVA
jgi:hypothetical protein